MAEYESEEKETDGEDTLEEAQELYHIASGDWSQIYEDAKDDQRFYGGDQWYNDDIIARRSEKRPTLITNHLPQFVHQVANEIRMNTPQIKVAPLDDKSSVADARIWQGLIRSIEKISNADIAYDTAVEYAIKSSFGFIRIDHDYVSPDTFEQHIIIKPVVNPLSVIIDSGSLLPDGSDAKYGFVLDSITLEDFERIHPDKDPVSFGSKTAERSESIMIAEYFCLKPEKIKIFQLADGMVLPEDKILELKIPKEFIKAVREIERNKVMRYKMSGADILERTIFPGSYIPIVPVYGEPQWIDGKRHIWSLIRNAKDAQRMINYYSSMEIESLSKAPQAPFTAFEGQLEGYESQWRNPHVSTVLTHVPTYDRNNNLLPRPERIQPPQVPTGAMTAKAAAVEEMKASMGLYNTSLGKQDNASSGLAIGRRQKQGEVATAHFGDNLNRSICHVGKIIMSMIPEIYDTQRIIRVSHPDDKEELVEINNGSVYNVNAGKYDVTVVSGPSFDTRREETQNMIGNIMQTNQALVPLIGDLFFKYSDVPGAEAISERLKKTLPPGLAEPEDGQPAQDPEKMQMQQALQQMQEQMQQMAAELQNKQGELQLKQGELQIKARELELRKMELEIEAMKAQAESAGDMDKEAFDRSIREREQRVKEYDAETKRLALAQKAENDNKEIALKLNTEGFQFSKTPEAEQADLQEKQLAEQAMLAKQDQEAQETALKMQQMQELQATIGLVAQQLNELTQAVKKPRDVIRDPNTGLIAGVV